MARLALIERELKRALLNQKYSNKRISYYKVINDSAATYEEKFNARLLLQQLPRNSSPTRKRNRCAITGRPRGFFRKFGLCRIKAREFGMSGAIPGVVKASW